MPLQNRVDPRGWLARDRYDTFRAAWTAGNGAAGANKPPPATELHAQLHEDRIAPSFVSLP